MILCDFKLAGQGSKNITSVSGRTDAFQVSKKRIRIYRKIIEAGNDAGPELRNQFSERGCRDRIQTCNQRIQGIPVAGNKYDVQGQFVDAIIILWEGHQSISTIVVHILFVLNVLNIQFNQLSGA
jgi:hypothetical protein